jgi:3-deoxy-D-manno-octulosonate 8-phosphate phosphatase (KDO 8-P phosphatase)
MTQEQTSSPPEVLVVDVDGVMTDGSFLYGVDGKFAKRFGADDHDALCLLKEHMAIRFVSGDHRGFPISRKRIAEDMKMELDLVSTTDRLAWIAERWDPRLVAYMGDGIFDGRVFRGVGYGIAVADALPGIRDLAHFVTSRRGGDRAVAEAALHLLETFFTPFDHGGGVPLSARQVVTAYIADFAAKRLDRLERSFADDVTLEDWDMRAEGKAAVLEACRSIFTAVGAISVDLIGLGQLGGAVVAEMAITLEGVGRLGIIDLIEVDRDGRIRSIRAFRGAEPRGRT